MHCSQNKNNLFFCLKCEWYTIIEKQYIEGKNNFVLIDEVQMCKEFERTDK